MRFSTRLGFRCDHTIVIMITAVSFLSKKLHSGCVFLDPGITPTPPPAPPFFELFVIMGLAWFHGSALYISSISSPFTGLQYNIY